MGAVTDLYDLAVEYLEACQAALALTPGGSIERAYVSPGSPAWDCCPQLTVFVGSTGQAATSPVGGLSEGQRITKTGAINLIPLVATVLRCVPTAGEGPSWPSGPAQEAAARELLCDVWAIWNLLVRRKARNELFGGRCREMMMSPSVPVGPSGACGGWDITVLVQLDGFDPEATP